MRVGKWKPLISHVQADFADSRDSMHLPRLIEQLPASLCTARRRAGPVSPIVPRLAVRFGQAESNTLGSYIARRRTAYQVVVTKLDTINRIVSGTFNGTLRGLFDSTRTLNIRYRRK